MVYKPQIQTPNSTEICDVTKATFHIKSIRGFLPVLEKLAL